MIIFIIKNVLTAKPFTIIVPSNNVFILLQKDRPSASRARQPARKHTLLCWSAHFSRTVWGKAWAIKMKRARVACAPQSHDTDQQAHSATWPQVSRLACTDVTWPRWVTHSLPPFFTSAKTRYAPPIACCPLDMPFDANLFSLLSLTAAASFLIHGIISPESKAWQKHFLWCFLWTLCFPATE